MYRNRLQSSTIALLFILLTFASIFSLYIPKPQASGEDVLVIPNEAIRLRILANSNSEEDQKIKRVIRDRVNAQITEWVSELTSLEDARNVIVSNLPELEKIALDVLEESNVNHELDVDFGSVSFPTKLYGQFLYPAGEYEAVLITIGEGTGANWWCVLFPPLCFLDFSSGSAVSDGFEDESGKVTEKEKSEQVVDKDSDREEDNEPIYVEEEEDEVEVKFFLFELIDKIVALFK